MSRPRLLRYCGFTIEPGDWGQGEEFTVWRHSRPRYAGRVDVAAVRASLDAARSWCRQAAKAPKNP